MTTEQNYQAVKSGCSALTRYEGRWNLPEAFAASLFTEEQMKELMIEGFTAFESVIIRSVREALSHTNFDVASKRVALIVSTTKGNVETLRQESYDEESEYPGVAARKIAQALGISTEPIVVCNACISGVAAQILAQRLIDAGLYDNVIVAGGEVQGKFIVSGFQAFKAVTDEICRPFDIERLGLNLGDGAGSIIFGKSESEGWHLESGAIRNDAYHLSAPHPQGEGYYQALKSALGEHATAELATLGVHGTATMYNDQMESKAIQRAGFSDVPLTSLKGYYGHTMGAAGVIETILTMKATDEGIILSARGFEEIGVSGKINISAQQQTTDKKAFIKTLSGFGGCNCAAMYKASPNLSKGEELLIHQPKVSHTVKITPNEVVVDGQKIATQAEGKQLLKELYKNHIGDYQKFYKMDVLTRLTFVASELLIKAASNAEDAVSSGAEGLSVILFNRSSSIVADKQFVETINNEANYYPSPSAFLYTLPNLTTGEIAIRNHFTGETSFYILPEKNEDMMNNIIRISFIDKDTTAIIGGWVDCPDENNFEAELSIYTK